MKLLNTVKLFNILEDQYGIFTRINEGGNCEFTNLLTGRKRITPLYSIVLNIEKLNEQEWAKAINKSLINFPQMAEQYGVVIRQWDNVKFGHWQLVRCVKEYSPKLHYESVMHNNYYQKEKHLIVGEKYRVLEAHYNNQVYTINESGKKFWYHEDHFEEFKKDV